MALISAGSASNRGRGARIGDLADGTSKTVLLGESKEERYNSWYDGATAWMSALPLDTVLNPIDSDGDRLWDTGATVSALNYGPDPTNPQQNFIYNPTLGASGLTREWGPSSEHSGIIIHAFADRHTQSVTNEVDWNIYCAIVTRQGNEPVNTTEL